MGKGFSTAATCSDQSDLCECPEWLMRIEGRDDTCQQNHPAGQERGPIDETERTGRSAAKQENHCRTGNDELPKTLKRIPAQTVPKDHHGSDKQRE